MGIYVERGEKMGNEMEKTKPMAEWVPTLWLAVLTSFAGTIYTICDTIVFGIRNYTMIWGMLSILSLTSFIVLVIQYRIYQTRE